MSRNIVFSLMIVTGFVGGTLLLGDGLSLRPAHLSAAEVQPEPAAPQGDQPEVTERGLPGQVFPPRQGIATPGSKAAASKVPILPKLAGAPTPPQKDPAPSQRPAATTQRSPTLNETMNVFRSLPGGVEAIENAKKRGAKIQSQGQLGGIMTETPQTWRQVLTPSRPIIGRIGHPVAVLGMDRVRLTGGWFGNSYYLRSDDQEQERGRVSVSVEIPRDGWYMVNFLVDFSNLFGPTGSVLLSRGQYTADGRWLGNAPISTIELRNDPIDNPRRSVPLFVELGAGHHSFELIVTEGTVIFHEVSITKWEG
jgi:hypothetical protein